MADREPTYFELKDPVKGTGMSQEDLRRCLYNLTKAVVAICNNLDEDIGNPGTDYMEKIGTDLETANANLKAPNGGPTV